MTKKNQTRKQTTNRIVDKLGRARAAHNRRLSERGFSQNGGGWNIDQAAAWSGIGSATLRAMAKAGQIPCIQLGRRLVIPRQGFTEWFNAQRATSAA